MKPIHLHALPWPSQYARTVYPWIMDFKFSDIGTCVNTPTAAPLGPSTRICTDPSRSLWRTCVMSFRPQLTGTRLIPQPTTPARSLSLAESRCRACALKQTRYGSSLRHPLIARLTAQLSATLTVNPTPHLSRHIAYWMRSSMFRSCI